MPAIEEPEAPAAIKTDIRIQQIGWVQDLDKCWAAKLHEKLKERMLSQKFDYAESGPYKADLNGVGSFKETIDPKEFCKLWKAGKIKDADFFAAVSVAKGKALEFMSAREVTAISESKAATPALVIARKKGIDVPLSEAVAGVMNALKMPG